MELDWTLLFSCMVAGSVASLLTSYGHWRKGRRRQRIKPDPPPRYDEVFVRGQRWLEEDEP